MPLSMPEAATTSRRSWSDSKAKRPVARDTADVQKKRGRAVVTRKLIVANGGSEREVRLVGSIIIGRDPACQVSEPDPLLSRRHAEIVAGIHGVSIRDLESRNGILVNGEKTREQVLRPGDVVQLGHLQVRYVEESAVHGEDDRAPGENAFAAALAQLQQFAQPDDEALTASPGARLTANAELTVTAATPECAELLGIPGDALVGDSLTDLFVRGLRRAYADPSMALSLTVARGAAGSIVVTLRVDTLPRRGT
jgi:hypothetical protein